MWRQYKLMGEITHIWYHTWQNQVPEMVKHTIYRSRLVNQLKYGTRKRLNQASEKANHDYAGTRRSNDRGQNHENVPKRGAKNQQTQVKKQKNEGPRMSNDRDQNVNTNTITNTNTNTNTNTKIQKKYKYVYCSLVKHLQ